MVMARSLALNSGLSSQPELAISTSLHLARLLTIDPRARCLHWSIRSLSVGSGRDLHKLIYLTFGASWTLFLCGIRGWKEISNARLHVRSSVSTLLDCERAWLL